MNNQEILRKETDLLKKRIAEDKSEDAYEEKLKRASVDLFPTIPRGEYKSILAAKMLENDAKESMQFQTLSFSSKEVRFLLTIPEEKNQRKIMFCLMIWEKLHPHPSHWIRFDFDKIISLMFFGKESNDIRRESLSTLVPYGLDFRVIGSKEAIPCYKIPVESSEDRFFETIYRREWINADYENVCSMGKKEFGEKLC